MKLNSDMAYNRGSPRAIVYNLADLIRKSRTTLLQISSLFPLDPFPDSLIVDENKVSIIHREFLGTKHVHSILIEDITDVTVDTSPICATIQITDSNNPRFPRTFSVRYLKIEEALEARRLIQGMIETNRFGIDISDKNYHEIAKQIEKVGRTKGE